MTERNFIKDVLLGVATGDALGVPVEFCSRSSLVRDPVTGMREFGTHHQPAGTWSDDSSLTFCLADMLCGPYNLQNLANRFINWKEFSYWTPHGKVFDIGIATAEAIVRLRKGTPPTLAGGTTEGSNGNGSLMRILPLLFYIKDMPIEQRFKHVQEVSSLTHAHLRSVNACFIYLELALAILNGQPKEVAYETVCLTLTNFLQNSEAFHFAGILSGQLPQFPLEKIYGTGYVVRTLEAAIWCLLNTGSYSEAVLQAVNLGDDTDTTAAVTGGLAGLLYGWETIPAEWLNVLAKRDAIDQLIANLQAKIYR
jgi:ADP-ribosyl-[dinitrogen reductase] hydrolase